jgi:hypothetical protein
VVTEEPVNKMESIGEFVTDLGDDQKHVQLEVRVAGKEQAAWR